MTETIYEVTEFYCVYHKEWHRKRDDKFSKCLNGFQAYHSFRVSKKEIEGAEIHSMVG